MTNIYYKAMSRDLRCIDQQFEEGEEYKIEGPPILCKRGFHFCKALVLTLEYYPVDECITENRYAEIEVLGDLKWEDVIKHKGVSNHIKIKRIIPDNEVKALVDNNSNSGHSNSGHRNSGHSNSGHRNSGNSNSGHRNSGNSNSGDINSGDRNSGDRNSGHRNSGHWNSGDWNSCSRETGYLNSKQAKKIRVFNKKCLLAEWQNAEKPSLLYFNQAAGESYKEAFRRSWDSASQSDRDLLKSLPNFDADVFFEISGVKVAS